MTPPSDFRQALRISGRFLLTTFVVGVVLFGVILATGVQLSSSVFGTLLAAKIGLVSLMTAVATFLFRNFWDETNLLKDASGITKTVHYYLGSFLFLMGSVLATVIAIGADFVIAAGNTADAWKALSLASFTVAIAYLLAFLLTLVGRTLAEMKTLLDATAVHAPQKIAASPVATPETRDPNSKV